MDIVKQTYNHSVTSLSEYEAKKLLSKFGIPVCREEIAENVEVAVKVARKIGFPVVLKVSGPKLLHKTDIGGVALNIRGEEEVIEVGKRFLEIPGCETGDGETIRSHGGTLRGGCRP